MISECAKVLRIPKSLLLLMPLIGSISVLCSGMQLSRQTAVVMPSYVSTWKLLFPLNWIYPNKFCW